jgi:hypothetical protein
MPCAVIPAAEELHATNAERYNIRRFLSSKRCTFFIIGLRSVTSASLKSFPPCSARAPKRVGTAGSSDGRTCNDDPRTTRWQSLDTAPVAAVGRLK